jgi:hypothetical protein
MGTTMRNLWLCFVMCACGPVPSPESETSWAPRADDPAFERAPSPQLRELAGLILTQLPVEHRVSLADGAVAPASSPITTPAAAELDLAKNRQDSDERRMYSGVSLLEGWDRGDKLVGYVIVAQMAHVVKPHRHYDLFVTSPTGDRLAQGTAMLREEGATLRLIKGPSWNPWPLERLHRRR